MRTAAKSHTPSRAPRLFNIGEKRPLEVWITRAGMIRMRPRGARKVLETSVGAAYFSVARSEVLSDLRNRQRRALRLAKDGKGARR